MFIPWLNSEAAEGQSIKFYLNQGYYEVGSSRTDMDTTPYLNSDNRTMVPLRFLGNALGVADEYIIWDNESKTATLELGGKDLKFTVGSSIYFVGDLSTEMDTVPELTGGRVMLPARYVAEAFGYKVYWVQNARAVMITTKVLDTSKPMDALLLEDIIGETMSRYEGWEKWTNFKAGGNPPNPRVDFDSSPETCVSAFFDGKIHGNAEMAKVQRIISVYLPDKADEINSFLELGTRVADDYINKGVVNEWGQKAGILQYGQSIYSSTSNGYMIKIWTDKGLYPYITIYIKIA